MLDNSDPIHWSVSDVSDAVKEIEPIIHSPEAKKKQIARKLVDLGINGMLLLTVVTDDYLKDRVQLAHSDFDLRYGILAWIKDLQSKSLTCRMNQSLRNRNLTNRTAQPSRPHLAPTTALPSSSERPSKRLKVDTIARSAAEISLTNGNDPSYWPFDSEDLQFANNVSYFRTTANVPAALPHGRHPLQPSMPTRHYRGTFKPSDDYQYFPIKSVFLPSEEIGDHINERSEDKTFCFGPSSYSRTKAAPYVYRAMRRFWTRSLRIDFLCGSSHAVAIPLYPESLIAPDKDSRQPAMVFTAHGSKLLDAEEIPPLIDAPSPVNSQIEHEPSSRKHNKRLKAAKRFDVKAILRRIDAKETEAIETAWETSRRNAVQAVERYCEGHLLPDHESTPGLEDEDDAATREQQITSALVHLADKAHLRKSGSNDPDDSADETRARDKRKQKVPSLSKSATRDCIELEVLSYRALWQTRKRPTYRMHAYGLWKATRNQGFRYENVRSLEAWASHVTTRLHNLRAKINKGTREKVKEACQGLEESVFELEKTTFLLDLWRRRDAPERRLPRRAARLQLKKAAGMALSAADEALFASHIRKPAKARPSQEPKLASVDVQAAAPDLHDFIVDDETEVVEASTARFTEEVHAAPAQSPAKHAANVGPTVIDLSSDDDDEKLVMLPPWPETLESLDVSGQIGKAAASDWIENPIEAKSEEVNRWDLETIWFRNDKLRLLVKAVHSLDRDTIAALRRAQGFSPKERNKLPRACHYYLIQMEKDVTGVQPIVHLLTLVRLRGVYELFDTGLLGLKSNQATFTLLQETIAASNQSGDQVTPKARKSSKHSKHAEPGEDWRDFVNLVFTITDRWERPLPLSRKMPVEHDAKQRFARERYCLFRDLKEPEHVQPTDSTTHTAECRMIPINLQRPPSEYIYIDCHLSSKLRPHQIEGVRFMWRELVVAEEKEGCLLSHTMGLGKTLQVFTLLETIARASKSSNPRIVQQIPPHLRKLCALILCPKTIQDNWAAEYASWLYNQGNDHLVQCHNAALIKGRGALARAINMWATDGGVLIIGYQIFARIVSKTKIGDHTEFETATMRKQLLHAPGIVVADEAHTLKNEGAQVSQAAAAIATKSRIALTGTPLANSLDEYYSMINWVSLNYVGPEQSFKELYKMPIEDGMYMDNEEKSGALARRRLKKLMRILEPKVHRRDITVLNKILGPKTEFIVFVPLTPIQQLIYDTYVEDLAAGEEEMAVRVFGWLNILSLLCTHPALFLSKLRERDKLRQSKGKALAKAPPAPGKTIAAAPSSPQALSTEENWSALVDTLPDSERLLQKIERCMADLPDPDDYMHSYKLQMLIAILGEAEKWGDKVIIFSQYSATLNFLQQIIKKEGYKTYFLDGTTAANTRQSLSTDFNHDPEWAVFLVSVKTGGVGLNLHGANRVITFDHLFNPMWEVQAIGRAYRMGQKKEVFVYHLSAGGTFEVAIHQTQMYKTSLSAGAIEGKFFKQKSWKLKRFVFPYQGCAKGDLSHMQGRDPLVLDVILKDGGCVIGQIETDDSLKEEMEEVGWSDEEELAAKGWTVDRGVADSAAKPISMDDGASNRAPMQTLKSNTNNTSSSRPPPPIFEQLDGAADDADYIPMLDGPTTFANTQSRIPIHTGIPLATPMQMDSQMPAQLLEQMPSHTATSTERTYPIPRRARARSEKPRKTRFVEVDGVFVEEEVDVEEGE